MFGAGKGDDPILADAKKMEQPPRKVVQASCHLGENHGKRRFYRRFRRFLPAERTLHDRDDSEFADMRVARCDTTESVAAHGFSSFCNGNLANIAPQLLAAENYFGKADSSKRLAGKPRFRANFGHCVSARRSRT